jgi:peptide/nickel transport system permease protein
MAAVNTQVTSFPFVKGIRRVVLRNPLGFASAVFLTLLLICAALAPVLIRIDPNAGSLYERMLPPGSAGHLLGTDALGRDVAARLLYGARISLFIALATVLTSGLLGTLIGVVSGYAGGVLDRILMRVIDVQLSFPFIVLALTIAAILGASLRNVIITLVISSWVYYARLARAETLKIMQRQYIEAASAAGSTPLRMLVIHLLPNLLPLMIVMASLEVGRIVVAEAGISFLGYGVQPPTAAWGNMINDGRDYIYNAWWLTALPGLAISMTVLAANLAGDWLRDLLDPRKQSTRGER